MGRDSIKDTEKEKNTGSAEQQISRDTQWMEEITVGENQPYTTGSPGYAMGNPFYPPGGLEYHVGGNDTSRQVFTIGGIGQTGG